ncbi:hypothetical protein VTI74DRAFT_7332 [Chaetomium olivicolor]
MAPALSKMAPSVKPLYAFSTIEEFILRHKSGTEAEFAATAKLVDAINKQGNEFQAWVLKKERRTKCTIHTIVVQPGLDGENKLPIFNEPAKLRVVFGSDAMTLFWDAERIDLPSDLASVTATAAMPQKLAAFKVTEYHSEGQDDARVQPLIVPAASALKPRSIEELLDNKYWIYQMKLTSNGFFTVDRSTTLMTMTPSKPTQIRLTDDNSVFVNFHLTASDATKNAEIGAIELLYGRYANASERQIHAANFCILLKNPEFVVDLHDHMPHLKTAMQDPAWPGSALAKKFDLLNQHQKEAYMNGLNNLPCGICILPGGPGAGKTHFNLFLIAMAQLQPLPRPVWIKGKYVHQCAKVLFIVDMNSPVDDVANRMARQYQELGMKKVAIRMKGWGTEVRTSGRLNGAEDAASSDIFVDFTRQFLQMLSEMCPSKSNSSCVAKTLDEAAWDRYAQYKSTVYQELTRYLEEELWQESQVIPLRFRRLVYHLYRDTLQSADFIATTPVAASNHFKGMFKPDLVFFDEAPHARELSNLIAVANYDPCVWFFCGDHRQTVPYVGSSIDGCENIYRDQMKISMMERAEKAGVVRHELLINHRAFGGLEQLGSTMWYGGRMVSGNHDRPQPESLTWVRDYLHSLAPAHSSTVPRLLVHLDNCGPEDRDGTSAWNPTHAAWVLARVHELLTDPGFKHAQRDEPGTVLIISPYKKAFNEYKKAIKTLPVWAQKRVEARTVDVVQGHEADFVFLDLVKDKSTRFLDDPNRLCVAVTRARIGEIILMHPDMVQSRTFLNHSQNLRRIYNLCKADGQVAWVDAEPAGAKFVLSEAVPGVAIVTNGSVSGQSDSGISVASPISDRSTEAAACSHEMNPTISAASIGMGRESTSYSALSPEVVSDIESLPPAEAIDFPLTDTSDSASAAPNWAASVRSASGNFFASGPFVEDIDLSVAFIGVDNDTEIDSSSPAASVKSVGDIAVALDNPVNSVDHIIINSARSDSKLTAFDAVPSVESATGNAIATVHPHENIWAYRPTVGDCKFTAEVSFMPAGQACQDTEEVHPCAAPLPAQLSNSISTTTRSAAQEETMPIVLTTGRSTVIDIKHVIAAWDSFIFPATKNATSDKADHVVPASQSPTGDAEKSDIPEPTDAEESIPHQPESNEAEESVGDKPSVTPKAQPAEIEDHITHQLTDAQESVTHSPKHSNNMGVTEESATLEAKDAETGVMKDPSEDGQNWEVTTSAAPSVVDDNTEASPNRKISPEVARSVGTVDHVRETDIVPLHSLVGSSIESVGHRSNKTVTRMRALWDEFILSTCNTENCRGNIINSESSANTTMAENIEKGNRGVAEELADVSKGRNADLQSPLSSSNIVPETDNETVTETAAQNMLPAPETPSRAFWNVVMDQSDDLGSPGTRTETATAEDTDNGLADVDSADKKSVAMGSADLRVPALSLAHWTLQTTFLLAVGASTTQEYCPRAPHLATPNDESAPFGNSNKDRGPASGNEASILGEHAASVTTDNDTAGNKTVSDESTVQRVIPVQSCSDAVFETAVLRLFTMAPRL